MQELCASFERTFLLSPCTSNSSSSSGFGTQNSFLTILNFFEEEPPMFRRRRHALYRARQTRHKLFADALIGRHIRDDISVLLPWSRLTLKPLSCPPFNSRRKPSNFLTCFFCDAGASPTAAVAPSASAAVAPSASAAGSRKSINQSSNGGRSRWGYSPSCRT